MSRLTQNRLKEVLNYCPESGVFTWAVDKARNVKKGMVAGVSHHSGYIYITIDRKLYGAHRLAWLYTNGEYPKSQIDHKNHIRTDNRIDNLREATHSVNQKNRKLSKNNKTGVCGVQLNKKNNRYDARIQKDGKKIYIGSFLQIDDAKKAIENARKEHGFHKNHGKELI